MATLLRNYDKFSFWLGFVAGALLVWLGGRLRPALGRGLALLRAQGQAVRQDRLVGDEIRLGNDTLAQVQGLHLAAPLFSLDEILISPRVLAPAPAPAAYEMPAGDDITDWCIPYTPDWPELASFYQAPSMSLLEALQGGANLVVTGQPGMGKSVALAHLATQVARNDRQAGQMAGFVPFLVHAADLNLSPQNPKTSLDVLLEAILPNVRSVALKRLPHIFQRLVAKQRVLLLLDGLDELVPDMLVETTEFLASLLKEIPGLRIVAAASPCDLDGLISAGFVSVTLANWTQTQRSTYITRWGDLWKRFIASPSKKDPQAINPYLLNGWLLNNTANLTPLEMTLKLWAAFAGDMLGPTPCDAMEAYLLRMTVGQPAKNRPAFEQLASQMALAMQPVAQRKNAEKWLGGADFAPIENEPAAGSESGPPGQAARPVRARGALPDLIESGLVIARAGERITIAHPLLAGYLASQALLTAGGGEQLAKQPDWSGKISALHYLAIQDSQAAWMQATLQEDDTDLRLFGLLNAARWLHDAPETLGWVATVLRKTAGYLAKEKLPLSLRARLLTALAFSGNSGVSVLLKQMLKSPQPVVRQLAVLGCGILRDTKSTPEINSLVRDLSPGVSRAAILALAAIGDKTALEGVAFSLLQGDESLRRAAAEALANHPEEGYPTLEEASALEEPAVRRAAAFGLGRVNEPWSIKILEKMRTEDTQWVVQDAASQVLQLISNPHPRTPSRLPAPTHTPWLIAFAGERGMGVAPGKPALDLLYLAIKQGNEDQRQAAMYYLGQNGDESAVMPLFQAYFSSTGETREVGFQALSSLACSGFQLPAPIQYGLR